MVSRTARVSDAAASAASRDKSLLDLLDPTDFMPGHTTADLYSLRHLTLRGGLPDSPSWLRAQAWKVLLGYLPPEKKEWSATLAKRRREYYQFVDDFAPPVEAPLGQDAFSDKDAMLDQIYKDLSRSRKNGFAFYQAHSIPSSSCPLSSLPETSSGSLTPVRRLDNRDSIRQRLAQINRDYAQSLRLEQKIQGRRPAPSLQDDRKMTANDESVDLDTTRSAASESSTRSPPILLSPPSPSGMSHSSSGHSFSSATEAIEEPSLASLAERITLQTAEKMFSSRMPQHQDRNWHSLLRILYLFALLNPSIGYVQGMNEALFTLFYVFGSAIYPSQDALHPSHSARSNLNYQADSGPSQPDPVETLRDWNSEVDLADVTSHAEADAFWCFSILMTEMRELYEFEELSRRTVPTSASAGMAGILCRFSLRLKWLDRALWTDLRTFNLDPRLPYYSVRWLACLLSTELSLPSVTRIWDALLAEQEQGASPASAKIDFLIDVSCAMLLDVKDRLPRRSDGIDEDQEAFSYGMRLLQAYPDQDISPVLEMAAMIRQRRLAAELTGDGPPADDEDEDAPASLKTRATLAYRDWTASSKSPQTGAGRWFGSIGLGQGTNSGSNTPDMSFESNVEDTSSTSTPSKVSFSDIFTKYADAVQRSDAAANLSKTSTNLTAKAMARFGDRSSRESTPEATTGAIGQVHRSQGSRIASLGTVSAGIFNKARRTVSTSTAASFGADSPRTPDMSLWPAEAVPHFPLPNVSDSPAGRMEYGETATQRNAYSHGDSGLEGAPNDSVNVKLLPSMRAAAKLGSLSAAQREVSSGQSSRAPGPKPLLLSQSARPPREASNGSGSSHLDEPSRKVSSGPMAHSMSRGNSQQDGRSSVANSSRRSSRSNADSRRSSTESPDNSTVAIQQNTVLPPLPSLRAQQVEHSPKTELARPIGADPSSFPRKNSLGSIGLQGLSSAEGKAPAGAFGRSIKNVALDTEAVRPAFGQVSSSSNVPLVAAGSTTILRPRVQIRKRDSSSAVQSRSASISGSQADKRTSNRISLTPSMFDGSDAAHGDENADSLARQQADEEVEYMSNDASHDRPEHGRTWSSGEAVQLSDAPMAEFAAPGSGSVQRYSLSDEPIDMGTQEASDGFHNSLGRNSMSSTGITRTKRLAKTRTGSSSSVASRRSIAAMGAGLRKSSRTSIQEPSPSSPKPLPELEEDTSGIYGGMRQEMASDATQYQRTISPDTASYDYEDNRTVDSRYKATYAQPDYENSDKADGHERPARRSQDSYASAVDQYAGSHSSHHVPAR